MAEDLDTDRIKDWRSIITLIVFVLANIVVLFPFHIPIYLPRAFVNAILEALTATRVIAPRQHHRHGGRFVRLNFPFNFVTAPLIADLFLLAILAIGRKEVHDGTLGADNISPIDIMVFFLTLAYIAISIDASGLIRFLAFKVLQKGGKVGHRLFFYLYAFFFVLGSFIGNDPIILSGTAFLAYMTRVSSNILHPRAWIYTQFAVANIASAILVSSNPTNLVLTSAFEIKFIEYTANMIVPVVITAIVLFPFLLYIIFADESLVPLSIEMHELPEEVKARKPVNPNIPNARGNAEEQEKEAANGDEGKLLSLEEILNPFLDKRGAAFGGLIMAATLIAVLVLNAASQGHTHPVFWVTLPAAFVLFCWDVAYGWHHRHETREIARKGREEVERSLAQKILEEGEIARGCREPQSTGALIDPSTGIFDHGNPSPFAAPSAASAGDGSPQQQSSPDGATATDEKQELNLASVNSLPPVSGSPWSTEEAGMEPPLSDDPSPNPPHPRELRKATLESRSLDLYRWLQETFPTVTAVVSHMPFALVPFAFAMFVLVQALATKGWIEVFAYGWDHWVNQTGTVGAIGGMGFLSVILCNFAGTNIGTTILLSRVIQTWQAIHRANGTPISDRTFWSTVYSMALGVNYGAFSTAFSASLAGLLWRDILSRKHIRVRSLDFAVVNLPIIAISMAVGCTVLVGEVYIMRDNTPYDA
ncbi:putative arsenite efflux transporter ArsB-like [Aspergillus lucknowensis]|uniref:Citrate transporter-like domain-containing protein n=1 Tax=Aspergillus lucknowensis TaxID=176173 RepID=A0ABR4LE43_9EURO